LSANGSAVFPADDDYTALWQSYADKKQTITFGLDQRAALWCEWKPKVFGSDLQIQVNGQFVHVSLAAAGEHNVRNALAAFAATRAVGIDVDCIVRGLQAFVPVAGRLQRKNATNGALVIDDTYNANPDSVRAAIDVLAMSPSPRTLILGDMGEVGSEGVAFHEEIGSYARTRHIDQLFTLGTLARHASLAFGSAGRHFDDVDTLNNELGSTSANASILIKGSRFMKMERVVERLTGISVGGH
jgi:UDP-N-acetylmuramoyl-tripeptide--D-alanyl-D-alanine ligase